MRRRTKKQSKNREAESDDGFHRRSAILRIKYNKITSLGKNKLLSLFLKIMQADLNNE